MRFHPNQILIFSKANACGTPTVGTFESGNEDAIQPGFGSLVRYGDVQALSRIIVEAMTLNPYPALDFDKIRTWGHVAEDYIRILNDVIADRKGNK
jgi:glycosyltransferase involved in cell wall biosynthesis